MRINALKRCCWYFLAPQAASVSQQQVGWRWNLPVRAAQRGRGLQIMACRYSEMLLDLLKPCRWFPIIRIEDGKHHRNKSNTSSMLKCTLRCREGMSGGSGCRPPAEIPAAWQLCLVSALITGIDRNIQLVWICWIPAFTLFSLSDPHSAHLHLPTALFLHSSFLLS